MLSATSIDDRCSAGALKSPRKTWILTLECQDRPRIVATIATAIADLSGDILESAQFQDRATNRYFMRVAFAASADVARKTVESTLGRVSARFGMTIALTDAEVVPRIVILVSKSDHCLEHLLYQIKVGWLRAEVAAIVSNHEELGIVAQRIGVPFHHWPVTKHNKPEQEAKLLDLYVKEKAELIVLARYMQILSDELSSRLFGHVINIHHSFLPGFKGAKPYHQAYDRGVKMIGATAHYVTADLDEGPIIEQETERVSHALAPEELVAIGRNVEAKVLARAVKYHLEGRVLLDGRRTIIL